MQLKESYASICDSSGALLLLSNGCYIETGDGIMVENSDGLNPGLVYENQCNGPYNFSYNSDNSMIFLQAPDSPSIYYLFHTRTYFTLQPLVAYQDVLFHTKIDMSLNNGDGKVLFKNLPVIQDTLYADGIHAVRHANGRDWWIVVSKLHSNKYYLVLFSPAGLKVKEQNIGEPTWSEAGGEIVFSPDGTKMARFNTKDDLRIFDFDRCTGELSNPVHVAIQDNADNELFAGLAFSADGHYLYAAEVKRILQFDMWAADIAASMNIVAERENFNCPFQSSLGYLELSPDGCIYSRNLNGSYCMHRINRPERPGAACEVQQNALNFEPYAFKGLPHFPNFRLGPIDGSPCDTLGLDNRPLAGWRYDRTGGLGVDFTSVSWYEPEQWLWNFGDPASGSANSSTEKHPSHTFSAPGGYEVCLTVSNQYGSDEKCKMVWVGTVGSGSPQWAEGGVQIYPNPTTGMVRWSGLEGSELVTVRVYNQLGMLVSEYEKGTEQIDLSKQPPGVYLFYFQAGHHYTVGKVMKQ